MPSVICMEWPEKDGGPSSMGVDQGKDLHVVIGRRSPAGWPWLAVYKSPRVRSRSKILARNSPV